MSFPVFLAKRFILPRKDSKFISFITLISIAGVAIGVAVLIIAVSVMSGFEKEITERAVSLSSHLQIYSFKQEGINDFPAVIKKLKDEKSLGIKEIHPYVQKEAVIKYKDFTDGILLKGIRNEDSVFSSQRKITEGSGVLSRVDSSTTSVIIGGKLAKKLGISIGSKVFVIATVGIPSATNTPNIKIFRVTGFYESGLKEYDDVLIYCDLKDAQKLFEMHDNITGLEVFLYDINKIKETTNEIKSFLGYPFAPKSIYQIYRGLFTWVELQKKPIPLILGLIVVVATFNLVAFLLMIILEKTEFIGILKSLGSTNRDIMKVFFIQGMFIAIIGIIIGNIFGYSLCLLQLEFNLISVPEIYYMTSVPIQFSYSAGLIIIAVTLILSAILTLLPSYLASRLSPITSLRFK